MPEGLDEREFVVATYATGAARRRRSIERCARSLAEHAVDRHLGDAGSARPTPIRERHAGRVLATWEMPDDEVVEPAPAP